jgi:hypothetical protein
MTIPVSDSENSYVGDGTSTAFPITFKFDTAADIKVVFTAPGGDPVDQTTGFQITGGSGSTGTCTFTVAPPNLTEVLILDDPELSQPIDYHDNDDFPAEVNERGLDRGVRISKRLANAIRNCLRVADGDAAAGLMELPNVTNRKGKYVAFNAVTGALELVALTAAGAISASIIGGLVNPVTQAETNTGITVTNPEFASNPEIVQRFGITPNNIAFAATNITRLRTLLNPTLNGPTGTYLFAPVIGGDTYHFSDWLDIRDNVTLDLCGCRLLFTASLTSAANLRGFMNMIRNVTIMNGTIEVNITGTGVGIQNAGMAYRIGSRDGYPFANYLNGILDKDDLEDEGLPPMGGCRLINVHFKSNNPYANAGFIGLGLGGLYGGGIYGCTFEGDGDAGAECGHYYEFGCSSKNGQPGNDVFWSSSHAINQEFVGIFGKNLKRDTVVDGYVIALVECSTFKVDGIGGRDVAGLFEARMGEAHWYRPWTPNNNSGKHVGRISNVSGSFSKLGINLNSAQDTAGGYLNDSDMTSAGLTPLTAQQKVDKQSFILENFDLLSDGGGACIQVSAPATLRNGTCRGGTHNLRVAGECASLTAVDVDLLDSTDINLRADETSAFAPRTKVIHWTKGKIAGAAGANGVSLAQVHGAKFIETQVGYSTARGDASDETTQLIGFNCSTAAENCEFDSTTVTTSGGALAYVSSSSSDRGNNIKNPRGNVTHTTNAFRFDDVAYQNQAALTAIAGEINTTRKYMGKKVYDTTNNVLRIAMGGAAGDAWRGVDGSAVLTPA